MSIYLRDRLSRSDCRCLYRLASFYLTFGGQLSVFDLYRCDSIPEPKLNIFHRQLWLDHLRRLRQPPSQSAREVNFLVLLYSNAYS